MQDLDVVGEWMPEGQREAFLRWARGLEGQGPQGWAERIAGLEARVADLEAARERALGAVGKLVPLGGAK